MTALGLFQPVPTGSYWPKVVFREQPLSTTTNYSTYLHSVVAKKISIPNQ
jgi:hypothetical protein